MVSATTYFKHVSLIHLCKCLVRAISSSPESSRMGCIQNISLSSRVAANPAKFACKLIVAHVSCRSANRWTTRKGAQESLNVAFHSHFRIARASLNNDVMLVSGFVATTAFAILACDDKLSVRLLNFVFRDSHHSYSCCVLLFPGDLPQQSSQQQ
jgi:hypothetical protein